MLPSALRADATPPARGRRRPMGPKCARERRQMHPPFDKGSYDCRIFPSSQAKCSARSHKRWRGRPVRPPDGVTAARQHRGSVPPGRPAVHRGDNGARHPLGYLLRRAVRSFACRPGEPSVACPFAGAKRHRRFVCIRLALQRLSSPCGPLPRHLDALATQVGETLRRRDPSAPHRLARQAEPVPMGAGQSNPGGDSQRSGSGRYAKQASGTQCFHAALLQLDLHGSPDWDTCCMHQRQMQVPRREACYNTLVECTEVWQPSSPNERRSDAMQSAHMHRHRNCMQLAFMACSSEGAASTRVRRRPPRASRCRTSPRPSLRLAPPIHRRPSFSPRRVAPARHAVDRRAPRR